MLATRGVLTLSMRQSSTPYPLKQRRRDVLSSTLVPGLKNGASAMIWLSLQRPVDRVCGSIIFGVALGITNSIWWKRLMPHLRGFKPSTSISINCIGPIVRPTSLGVWVTVMKMTPTRPRSTKPWPLLSAWPRVVKFEQSVCPTRPRGGS